MISIPLDYEKFAHCFMSLDMFQCLLVYSLEQTIVYSINYSIVYRIEFESCWLCENHINPNYVKLVHSTSQVYYILLLFCLFISLSIESFILKLQLKIFIYLKNNYNIQWNYIQLCSIFSKSPVNVLSYFHNLKK